MGSSHEQAEDADLISARPARLVAKPRVEPIRVRVIAEVMEEAESFGRLGKLPNPRMPCLFSEVLGA